MARGAIQVVLEAMNREGAARQATRVRRRHIQRGLSQASPFGISQPPSFSIRNPRFLETVELYSPFTGYEFGCDLCPSFQHQRLTHNPLNHSGCPQVAR
jgi:hypothetical protein